MVPNLARRIQDGTGKENIVLTTVLTPALSSEEREK
jgi:hypothetical protein